MGLHHSSHTNMAGIDGKNFHYAAVLIHGCIHSEGTVGMGTNHNVSHFVRLLVPEGKFMFASYQPVGHGSLKGLKVNELVSYFHGHGKEG